MGKRFHEIAATDKFAALLFRNQPEVREIGHSEGQWIQLSPDGKFVQLWETTPSEFRAQLGESVVLDQRLWDGATLRPLRILKVDERTERTPVERSSDPRCSH